MSTITTRAGKGSPLTNNEVDSNFSNLNTDKAELSGATFTGDVTSTGFSGDITGAVLFQAKAGEAFTKGDPVYISGISGNTTVVSKADANDANKMPCFGIVNATVSINANCSVVTFGTLSNLNTSAFSEGDELYISDTGTLSSTAPTGETSQLQKIAKVTRAHASAGSIKVMGAGRTNATPNLNDGKFFLGNSSNQSASATFSTSVTDIALPLSGGAMTGAITTNSTFDGRDVATDGTKLDGIESGATITNTANVTSAGALMDSELTSIASVKALNQGVATTDSPTFAGLNATGDLTLDAAGDIILDADGADVILKDGGTSFLEIDKDGNNARLKNPIADGDIKIQGIDGASTITALSLDMSAAGAATFNAGATFNGTATMDGLTVDGATVLDIGDEGTLQVGPTTTVADENQTFEMRGSNGSNELQRFQIANRGEDGTVDFKYGRAGATPTKAISIGSGTGDISFYEDTGTTAKFFWDASAESLGIGVSPSATLDIAGDNTYNRISSYFSGSYTSGFKFSDMNGGIWYDAGTDDLTVSASHANSQLILESGGSPSMTLDSSGNVGIGVVPSAWHASWKALQMGPIGFVGSYQASTTDITALGSNVYSDGTYKYIETDEAVIYKQQNGEHIFDVAPSGSAGSAISWNTAMTIDNSGNVGIGVDVPDSLLHIKKTTADAKVTLETSESYDCYINFSGATSEAAIGYNATDNALLFCNPAGDLTAGEAMRIDSSGNLLVGGTSAGTVSGNNAMITVRRDTGNCGISYQSGNYTTDQWETYTNLAARFYIENTSTSNGAYLQYNISSGWTNISDERWKTNWTSLGDSSSKIAALNVGKYHMLNNSKESIEGAKWDYGVKAQELLEVIPDAVDVPENPEDKYGVVSNIVFWHAVKAIQEQQTLIESLTARIAALEE